MFQIISPLSSFKRHRKIILPLVYKSRKMHRLRRRRFALTKFSVLLTTTLVFFYKRKFSLIKGAKVKIFRAFKQLRFGNSQKKIFGRFSRQATINLRHLELNSRINSFTVLPIPYGYFYSFLLDQTFLWKSVLVELHLYYRS